MSEPVFHPDQRPLMIGSAETIAKLQAAVGEENLDKFEWRVIVPESA